MTVPEEQDPPTPEPVEAATPAPEPPPINRDWLDMELLYLSPPPKPGEPDMDLWI